MALIKCPECMSYIDISGQSELSEKASACPQCGLVRRTAESTAKDTQVATGRTSKVVNYLICFVAKFWRPWR